MVGHVLYLMCLHRALLDLSPVFYCVVILVQSMMLLHHEHCFLEKIISDFCCHLFTFFSLFLFPFLFLTVVFLTLESNCS
jgi:hypothetical protein